MRGYLTTNTLHKQRKLPSKQARTNFQNFWALQVSNFENKIHIHEK